MNRSESIADLAAALAKAQGEIKGAAKDSTNPHFKAKYADLASVWEACRTALTKNGLAVTQITETDDAGNIVIETMLMHSGGQWISGRLGMKPQQFTPQAAGSVITYCRRYALAAMVGVAPEDDDAEGAEGRGNNGGPEIGRPAAPRNDPKTAPRTASPKTDDAAAHARALFVQISEGISKAANPEGLQALMKARADDLQTIKATSEEGYNDLIKKSNKRTTELSQAPIPNKEAA